MESGFVRAALATDLPDMERVAATRYPEGWTFVNFDHWLRGWVLEEPHKGVVGYAIYDAQDRYLTEIAVLPGTPPRLAAMLIKRLLMTVREQPGSWSADCRRSTSYELMRRLERKGAIRILSDQEDGCMGDEPMRNVVFEVT